MIVGGFGVCRIDEEDLDMPSKILPVYCRAIDEGVIPGISKIIVSKEPLQDVPAFPPGHSTFVAL